MENKTILMDVEMEMEEIVLYKVVECMCCGKTKTLKGTLEKRGDKRYIRLYDTCEICGVKLRDICKLGEHSFDDVGYTIEQAEELYRLKKQFELKEKRRKLEEELKFAEAYHKGNHEGFWCGYDEGMKDMFIPMLIGMSIGTIIGNIIVKLIF